MFISSSAWSWRCPYAASSSRVPSVEVEPFATALRDASSIAIRNTADAEERTDGLEEVVKIS